MALDVARVILDKASEDAKVAVHVRLAEVHAKDGFDRRWVSTIWLTPRWIGDCLLIQRGGVCVGGSIGVMRDVVRTILVDEIQRGDPVEDPKWHLQNVAIFLCNHAKFAGVMNDVFSDPFLPFFEGDDDVQGVEWMAHAELSGSDLIKRAVDKVMQYMEIAKYAMST